MEGVAAFRVSANYRVCNLGQDLADGVALAMVLNTVATVPLLPQDAVVGLPAVVLEVDFSRDKHASASLSVALQPATGPSASPFMLMKVGPCADAAKRSKISVST